MILTFFFFLSIRIADDHSRVTLGAAGVDETLSTHRVSLSTADGAVGASPLISLTCGAVTWSWYFPPARQRVFELRYPGGDCSLGVSAPGYKTSQRKIVADARSSIYLYHLPVLSGVVVDRETNAPIVDAEILLSDGKLVTRTDSNGRFSTALDPWPAGIRVTASGRAMRTLSLSKAVADTELRIPMSKGGSVVVEVEPPLGNEDVQWELRRVGADSEDKITRTGRLPAGQLEVIIDAVEAGSYRVIVMGERPLQRVAVPVVVSDGATVRSHVRIEPAALHLDVRFGDKPLEDANVEIRFDDQLWRSVVSTDAEGRAEEEIWQRGDYVAYIARKPLLTAARAARRVVNDGVNSWTISIPDRKVRGRILDAAANQPIDGARVILRSTANEGATLTIRTVSERDGTFEFTGVGAGSYRLTVFQQGYAALETPEFGLSKDVSVEVRDLTLRRLAERVVRVVNARGVPLPRTAVLLSTQGAVLPPAFTDDQGEVKLSIAEGDAGFAFALPATGSIGVARLQRAGEMDRDLVIRVADGLGTLEVIAKSAEKEPVPGLAFLMAIDGVLVPPSVSAAMADHQGVPQSTDASGRLLLARMPPGRYEIWPLASRADFEAVRSAAPPPAPVNVTLTPGHHTATLTFRRK